MLNMWKKHQKFMSGNAGFSLVELIIVIAIMAALVAILAPQYLKYVEKSRVSADKDTAASLVTSAKILVADEDLTLPDSFTLTWYKDADGKIAINFTPLTGGTSVADAQSAVNSIFGSSIKKPQSKTVTADYVITASYANNTWTLTESVDLTSLAATV